MTASGPTKAPSGAVLATDLMAILNMRVSLEVKDQLIRKLVEAALQN